MKKIEGIIEYKGEEYDYTAVLQASERDYMPERVTDLDRADGEPMSDSESEDFETMADLALENARLLDWCEPRSISVSLPSLSHPTSTIKAAGMAIDRFAPESTNSD